MGFYQHTQSVSSTTWSINHNLGTQFVVSDALITAEKVLPLNVEIVDDNNITITFSTAQTGSVRIVG